MKKLFITISILIITITLSSCNLIVSPTTTSSSAVDSPNADYCVLGQYDDVYLCEKKTTSYFDTTVSLKLYYDENDNYDVLEIFDYFEDTLETYHQYLDKYNEYLGINNVYTINHSDEPLVIEEILFGAIEFALDNDNLITKDDIPLFDIALGPVLEIWHDARNSDDCSNTTEMGISYCPVPTEIDGVTFNINPSDIILNSSNMTIDFASENMSIDLGGYGKGYVTKVISDHLDTLNIKYLLNVGNSNVFAGGTNPNSEDGYYYIALIKPVTEFQLINEYFQYIQMPSGIALVTSGVNQRYFKDVVTSEIYHHIIDPTTYYPGGYCKSITIVYPDSAMADLLSTAIFLLPLDEALEFVNNYEDLEAVWYVDDDNIIYSDGFDQYVYLLE
ncbi:MAG: FAD:protein FMN transferase [Tenericutes bacterium]|nr:FAD:protein FMN transferase [Mycoplasmatota bacterium]